MIVDEIRETSRHFLYQRPVSVVDRKAMALRFVENDTSANPGFPDRESRVGRRDVVLGRSPCGYGCT
jgi:hypothetical protein